MFCHPLFFTDVSGAREGTVGESANQKKLTNRSMRRFIVMSTLRYCSIVRLR